MEIMKTRHLQVLVLVLLVASVGSGGCVRIGSRVLGIGEPGPGKVIVERNIMVPMRDGVRLATDVYRPAAPGRYPVILTRIPYGTDPDSGFPFKYTFLLGKIFVKQGYVFVAQDTRGEFDSEGVWFPLIYEYDDGHDTTAWITEQPWYDGHLGMWGASYFGYTQLMAAPGNTDLKALNPWVTSGNIHRLMFRGGASNYIGMEGWLTQEVNNQAIRHGEKGDKKIDLTRGWYNDPIRDAEPVNMRATMADPDALAQGPWPWINHPGDTEDVEALNYDRYYKEVSVPSLLVAGWYDCFIGPQMVDFVRLREEGIGDAKKTRIIVGPWVHGEPMSKFEESYLAGPKLYGSSFMEWYDYWLKEIDNGAADKAPLLIFVMGDNVWREEQEWPLARTRYVDYYIHSEGRANSSSGDGSMDTTPPGDEPADQYSYDPRNPVPTRGGSFLGSLNFQPGAVDQRPVQKRRDVLVYVTEPLSGPVEVTGPITVTLYAASSAIDTDWTAKLVDVAPNGYAQNLQDGIIRARYRDGYQHPTAIEPGKIYEYKIDLLSTSNVFLKGHRIGLEISSSNFPQFDRNTNAGGVGGPDNIIVAGQSIYHDREHATRITLPVIPR